MYKRENIFTKPEESSLKLENDEKIKKVSIVKNELIENIYLSNLPNLKEILINDNPNLKSVTLGKGLESVTVIYISLSDSVTIVDQNFKALYKFTISHCNNVDADFNDSFNNVIEFFLKYCKFKDKVLRMTSKFTSVNIFEINDCNLINMEISFDLSNIFSFDLSNNNLEELSIIGVFKNLECLFLSGNNLKRLNIPYDDVSLKTYRKTNSFEIIVDENVEFPIALKPLIENEEIEVLIGSKEYDGDASPIDIENITYY